MYYISFERPSGLLSSDGDSVVYFLKDAMAFESEEAAYGYLVANRSRLDELGTVPIPITPEA